MADPKEAALNAMAASVKNLQKALSFLLNLSKKLIQKLDILIKAIKALLAKLNQIRQLLPSALLSTAKKSVTFLAKFIKDIPLNIKKLLRFVKSLADAIKRGAEDTLEAVARLALSTLRTMAKWVLGKVKQLMVYVKPLERLRAAIQQAESVIKAVVEEIADILMGMASVLGAKTLGQTLLKSFKKVESYIGETEKNLDKYARAGSA